MTSTGPKPFTLRPWPVGDKKPKNLADFIGRVNAEQEGFRALSESKLRDTAQNETQDFDNTANDEDDEDDEETEEDELKTIITAREEFFKNIDVAHQSAMLALDSVSLLLSKEMPVQAGETLSHALRELVGIGTLGGSKLHDTNVSEPIASDNIAVATGWRVMSINKMVDAVVSAAERLETEMEKEAKYWSDILAVSESGWAVCSLPQEPHTLGVRYGFSEAAPEFRDSSLAPLRRDDDGAVRLEHGRIYKGSRRVRVAVERQGKVTGRSLLPSRIPDDAPLQDRVLEARNTIFAQELWHEVNREARTLLSLGVLSDGTSVSYQLDPETLIVLTIHDLSDQAEGPVSATNGSSDEDDKLAEGISIALHCLLSYGHRCNYRIRTNPVANRPLNQHYLLRPLITRAQHTTACDAIKQFTSALVVTLQRAGMTAAACTHTAPPVAVQPQQATLLRRSSKSEVLTQNLISILDFSCEVAVTSQTRISVRGNSSFMSHWIRLQFLVSLPPPIVTQSDGDIKPLPPASAPSGQQNEGNPNPLQEVYPPAPDPYPSADAVIIYIRQATVRALTTHYAAVASEKLLSSLPAGTEISAYDSIDGPAISANLGSREIRLSLSSSKGRKSENTPRKDQGEVNGELELVADAQWEAEDGQGHVTRRTGQWVWKSMAPAHEGNQETLEGVILKVLGGTA